MAEIRTDAALAVQARDTRLRVFLSYSRKDSDFIARLATALQARGYLADFDRSTHDAANVETGISAEDEWWKRLQEMIVAADVTVFAVSPDAAKSKVCDEEIVYARGLGKRVIAVLRRPVDFATAPPRLAALNVKISFVDDAEAAFARSVDDLVFALERDVVWLREQTRLTQAATDWDASGRREDELLRGAEISEAEAWSARRPASAPETSDLVLAFLGASRKGQTEREEKERRSLRRQRAQQAWIGALIVIALGITAAGGWYVVGKQRTVAESQSLTLARSAQRLLQDNDYAGALRLAVLSARNTFLTPASPDAEPTLIATATASPLIADFAGHTEPVLNAIFSPDEKRVLTFSDDKTLRLWDAETGAALGVIQGLRSARFNKDGSRIHTWNGSGEIQAFDGLTAKPVGKLIKAPKAIVAIAVSPDETKVAYLSGGKDDYNQRSLNLRNLSDGSEAAAPVEFVHMGRGVLFSNDGKHLLTWADGFTAQLHDPATLAPVGAPMKHDGVIAGAAFSPDQMRVLTWSSGGGNVDSTARLWDASTGAPVGAPMRHTKGGVREARYIAKGTRIVTISGDGDVGLWDAATSAPIATLSHRGNLDPNNVEDQWQILQFGAYDADYDETTNTLITIGSDKVARQWDADTGAPKGVTIKHDVLARKIKYVAGGRSVATIDDGGVLHVWDRDSGRQLGPDIPTEGPWGAGVFSRDGRRLMAFDYSTPKGRAKIWSTEANRAATPWMMHGAIVRGAAMARRDAGVVSWGDDNAVRFWDAKTHKAVGQPGLHEGYVIGGTVSPAGDRVVTVSVDGFAKQWDAAGKGQIGAAMKADSFGAVYLDGGKTLVTVSYDRIARLWNASTGARIGADLKLPDVQIEQFSLMRIPFSHEPSHFYGAQPSRDGSRLAVFANSLEARLMDAKTGAAIGSAMKHETPITGAVFSSTETWIATWSGQSFVLRGEDDSVRLWRGTDGVFANIRLEHPDGVRGVAFSEDDSQVLTWSEDGGVRLWSLPDGKLAMPVMQHKGPVFGARFSPDETQVLSWGQDGSVRVWDRATGKQDGPGMAHRGSVVAVSYSPDRRFLLTVEQTNVTLPQIHVWDLATRQKVAQLATGMGLMHGAGWVGDGHAILSWGESNAAQLWEQPWLAAAASVTDRADKVCANRLRGGAVEIDLTGNKTWAGSRRITASDVEAAPILKGREGEDVCAWKPKTYDRALDAAWSVIQKARRAIGMPANG